MISEERKKYLRLFLTFFIVLTILQVLDVVFTTWMINYDGTTDVEANPFMRFIFNQPNGSYLALLVKVVVMLLWFLPAYAWVKHPINFYNKHQRNLFIFVPCFITSIYLVVVGFQIFQIWVVTQWL